MLAPKVPIQVGSDATVIKLAAFKVRKQERVNHTSAPRSVAMPANPFPRAMPSRPFGKSLPLYLSQPQLSAVCCLELFLSRDDIRSQGARVQCRKPDRVW